jgi:hypothetical protein
LPHPAGWKRIDLYLESHGAGALVGTVVAQPMGDTENGTPGSREAIAMATLDAERLTVRPDAADKRYAGLAAQMTLTCRYAADGPTLTCVDPNGVTISLQRHSETLTPDAAQLLAAIRAALPGE